MTDHCHHMQRLHTKKSVRREAASSDTHHVRGSKDGAVEVWIGEDLAIASLNGQGLRAAGVGLGVLAAACIGTALQPAASVRTP